MRFFACFVKWNNERFVLCSPPLRVHRRLQADVPTIQRQTKKTVQGGPLTRVSKLFMDSPCG